MNTPHRKFQGVIVPLVTPLSSRSELDLPGLERLVEHVINGGVHGIFLLGTTGESAAICNDLRRKLVDHVCKQVQGRVPVLVGISDTAVLESLRLAEHAASAGADAVVVTTPFYLPLESRELVRYVRTVSQESSLPVLLYNMPELTKTWFSIEVLQQLLELENIAGLKDSSADLNYFSAAQKIMSQRPDWSLFIGSDSLMSTAVRNGAHGGVTGGANVCPALFSKLYEASLANDLSLMEMLQARITELANIYQFGEYAVGSIRGIKCALHQMDISNDILAEPFYPANDSERHSIESTLQRLGLIAAKGHNDTSIHRFDTPSSPKRIYGSPVVTNTPCEESA